MTNLNKTEFISVYDILINLWPETIDVREKIFQDNGGASIPNLISVKDDIESKLESVSGYDEHLHDHINWAIFKLLHQLAKQSNFIHPRDIDKDEVFKIFNENEKAIIELWEEQED